MSTVHERDDIYSHDHKRTYESQFMEKDKKFQEGMAVDESDVISIHDQKPTYEGHFME